MRYIQYSVLGYQRSQLGRITDIIDFPIHHKVYLGILLPIFGSNIEPSKRLIFRETIKGFAEMKCRKHRRYQALKKSKVDCPDCMFKFSAKQKLNFV